MFCLQTKKQKKSHREEIVLKIRMLQSLTFMMNGYAICDEATARIG